MRNGPFIAGLVALAGLAFAAAAPTVRAWNPIGPKWPSPSASYDPHTLSSSWKSVASFGATQWNNVTPSPWAWSVNNSSNNDVIRSAIDGRGGTLAVTTIYYSGSTITRMTIKFDTAERWYLGSGSPASNQVDGRSVSAHEFGHGLGLGHTSSSNCPGNSNNATMCPSYYMGTTWQRTLQTDDRNGLNSLYP